MSNKNDDRDDICALAFNLKKVRYALLDECLGDSAIETRVNVFVDMRYILDILSIEFYATPVRNEFIKKPTWVMGDLFNWLVHYKRYFTDKRGCNVRFFLMFDSGLPDPYRTAIVPEHGQKKLAKTVAAKYVGFIGEQMKKFNGVVPGVATIHSDEAHLSVIPHIVNASLAGKAKTNIFITNNPAFHFYSGSFSDFICLHAAGDRSKAIPKNGFFRYLYEKNKWAVKDKSELSIDDSFVRLFLTLTGGEDEIPVGKYKKKKAVDFINDFKDVSPIFAGYEDLEGRLAEDEIAELVRRDEVYNPIARAMALTDSEVITIQSCVDQIGEGSRRDFQEANRKYFDNSVDEIVLFT